MMDDYRGFGSRNSGGDDLVEIDLNFESMRRFQAEFSPNLSRDGLFIDTGEPLSPGSVVRFRVILPEEFVFLEGTAVVEWIRSAEAVCDGAHGMALRFVTLSPQNQELVEQLVSDHMNAGGSRFDLDVRPVPADFPTDSLEGAPTPSTGSLDEGYKLTVRHTGPTLQAEALRALAEAAPGDDVRSGLPDGFEGAAGAAEVEAEATLARAEAEGESAIELDEMESEETHAFEIVSGPSLRGRSDVVPAADEDTSSVDAEVEAAGDPPELDWLDEAGTSAAPEMSSTLDVAASTATDRGPDAEAEEHPAAEPEEAPIPFAAGDGPAAMDELFKVDETVAVPEVLLTPSLFEDGPEIIDVISDGDLGSPAFDVSLPEHDDGPDTTPMLPDEGRDDVRVTPEDTFDEPEHRRKRGWPWALAAVLVVAVGAGFLWPYAMEWLESRGAGAAGEPAVVEVTRTEEEAQFPVAEQQPIDPAEMPGSAGVMMDGSGEGDDQGAAVAEVGSPEAAVEAVVEEAQPEPAPAVVRVAVADTVTAIGVETVQGGTAIRIRANGSVEDGVLSMETLPSPPRVLIRVRGITSSYRPYVVEAMTAEVTQVRSGLHEERRPSELWIVVDLADPDVAVGGVDIRGDAAEIVLVRP